MMSELIHSPLAYFRPSNCPLWRWADNGSVLAWHNGATIAYYDQINNCFTALVHQGLPDFDSIALCLAALSKHWPKHVQQCRLQQYCQQILMQHQVADDQVISGHDISDMLFKQLNELHNFSLEHRSLKSQDILYYIFEQHNNRLDSKQSQIIRNCFENEIPGPAIEALGVNADTRDLREHLLSLCNTLDNINFKQLDQLITSGVVSEQLQNDEENPIEHAPLNERLHQCLDELEQDGEWTGIKQLVTDLQASIHLPRNISNPDQLREGGFSDINNKGTPDKLLLSELANDDHILMARLALNEALYLERETPKQKIDRSRHIYIENGINMWGLGRVYAIAMAIAVALDQHESNHVTWHFIAGKRIIDVDLSTLDGLKEALASMHHAPFPICQELAHETDTENEAVFICHQDTFTHKHNHIWLQKNRPHFQFLCHLNGQGAYQLLQQENIGSHVIKKAVLNLDNIVQSDNENDTLIGDKDSPIPLCLQTYPFALRVNSNPDPRTSIWSAGRGLISLTSHGHLLLHDEERRGALCLCSLSRIPDYYWLCQDYSGTLFVVGLYEQNSLAYDVEVCEYNLVQKAIINVWHRHISAQEPLAARKVKDHLIISAKNGAFLLHREHEALNHFYQVNIQECYDGLHFQHDLEWFRLYIENDSVLKTVLVYAKNKKNPALICFDTPDSDGTWVIDQLFNMHNTGNSKRFKFSVPKINGHNCSVRWTSPGRSRIAISAKAHGSKLQVLRTNRNHEALLHERTDNYLFPSSASGYSKGRHNTRNKFVSVGIFNDMLYLKTPKQSVLGLDLSQYQSVWRQQNQAPNAIHWVNFNGNHDEQTQDEAYSLIHTELIGTFRFWIDRRGYLIMQNDSEWLVFTIQDGQCAIASSDGSFTGRSYFLPKEKTHPDYSCISRVRRLFRLYEKQL